MSKRELEPADHDDADSHLSRAKTLVLSPAEATHAMGRSFAVRANPLYQLQRPLGLAAQRELRREAPARERIKLLLVRHGESEANKDPLLHTVVSDHSIPLSALGLVQARAAGSFVAQYCSGAESGPAARRIISSPYKRARDTAHEIVAAADGALGDMTESVLLGEQQFGLFEGLPVAQIASSFPLENRYFEKAIESGGRFWARPPLGESRFDVCVRVVGIIDSILSDEFHWGINTFVIVAHGITLRALAMMWLNRTPEWFEAEPNPLNCSVRLLDGLRDCGYVFKGFHKSAEPAAAKVDVTGVVASAADDEEDALAYTQRQMTVSGSSGLQKPTQKQALLKRLDELAGELEEIRVALREDGLYESTK